MPKKSQRRPKAEVPDPIVHALANLGHRIEKLERNTIGEAASAIAALNTPSTLGMGMSTKGGSPPSSLETATTRILEATMKLRRIEGLAYEFANGLDGPAPTASDPITGAGEKPHLQVAITFLERQIDAIFDQIGRIHPNPRG